MCQSGKIVKIDVLNINAQNEIGGSLRRKGWVRGSSIQTDNVSKAKAGG